MLRVFLLILLVVGSALWLMNHPTAVTEVVSQLQIETPNDLLEILEKEITAPPPLRGSTDQPAAALTGAGVLKHTNQHRVQANLAALRENTTLNQAAQNKLNDLFAQQYFDHISPTGQGPADVVEAVHYQYLRVGENLALGNYSSDADLVQAWMDSPGHRANILSPGFTELGVAVGQGTFEGKATWLAVQTFGLGASTCPVPPKTLQQQVEARRQAMIDQSSRLPALRTQYETFARAGEAKIAEGNKEIEEGNRIAREGGSEEEAQEHWDRGEKLQAEGQTLLEQARAKQGEYNKLVEEINSQNDQLKNLIADLNRQIAAYNNCLERF